MRYNRFRVQYEYSDRDSSSEATSINEATVCVYGEGTATQLERAIAKDRPGHTNINIIGWTEV